MHTSSPSSSYLYFNAPFADFSEQPDQRNGRIECKLKIQHCKDGGRISSVPEKSFDICNHSKSASSNAIVGKAPLPLKEISVEKEEIVADAPKPFLVMGPTELRITQGLIRDHVERVEEADELCEGEQEDDEGLPSFEKPLSLINMEANLYEFLSSKRISDAVKVLTRNFPELPSKKRIPYSNIATLSDNEKEEVHKKRNRENAALTRKRLKIYSKFLDKAIEELTLILSGKKEVNLEELLTAAELEANRDCSRRKRSRAKKFPSSENLRSLCPPGQALPYWQLNNSEQSHGLFETCLEPL